MRASEDGREAKDGADDEGVQDEGDDADTADGGEVRASREHGCMIQFRFPSDVTVVPSTQRRRSSVGRAADS